MGGSSKKGGNRSISIGGNVSDSAVFIGDRNRVAMETLPQPDSVDLRSEIAALCDILTKLTASDADKIAQALADAETEAAKPEPDKDTVGRALDRALEYADKAGGLVDASDRLIAHVINVAGWLGANWRHILRYVGLVS
jgi:hypothetical protein